MTEFGLVERFWMDAVGEPGDRTFYAIVVSGDRAHWFTAEKEQVATLSQRSLELLAEAGFEPDPDAVVRLVANTDIGPPADPEFRISSISLAVDVAAERIRIILESAAEPSETVSFDLVPEQLMAAAHHGLTVVAAGRPICPLCRLPEDPAGHDCPAVNGHRT